MSGHGLEHDSDRTGGRPRDPSVDDAIITTAREMLLEYGYEKLSIERVARQAGVAKTSIYRRWESKPLLALAAIESMRAELPFPDTGSLASDLEAIAPILRQVVEQKELRQILATFFTILSEDDEVVERYWALFVQQRRDDFATMFERARERGEVRSDLDLDIIIDMVSGTVAIQMLRPLSHNPSYRIDRLIRTVLTITGASTQK